MTKTQLVAAIMKHDAEVAQEEYAKFLSFALSYMLSNALTYVSLVYPEKKKQNLPLKPLAPRIARLRSSPLTPLRL